MTHFKRRCCLMHCPSCGHNPNAIGTQGGRNGAWLTMDGCTASRDAMGAIYSVDDHLTVSTARAQKSKQAGILKPYPARAIIHR